MTRYTRLIAQLLVTGILTALVTTPTAASNVATEGDAIETIVDTVSAFEEALGESTSERLSVDELVQTIASLRERIESTWNDGLIDDDRFDGLRRAHRELRRSLRRLRAGNFEGAVEHAERSGELLGNSY